MIPGRSNQLEYRSCWAVPWALGNLIASTQQNPPIVEQQYVFGLYIILLSFNNRYAILVVDLLLFNNRAVMGLPTYYRSTIGLGIGLPTYYRSTIGPL
jgi:hypothetical protein